MNLRDLKYLIAVSETRHFGQAAELCFVSQPTLSGQIKKLEEQLNVTLFERTNRSVFVTPIGEQIIERARRILEQVEQIEHLAKTNNNPTAGVVRIGIISTLSTYLIPLFLPDLIEAHPHIDPILSENLSDQLVQNLINHDIDVVITASQENFPDLNNIHLFNEPLLYVSARSLGNTRFSTTHSLTPSIGDINSESLLLLSNKNCLTQQVYQLIKQNQLAFDEQSNQSQISSIETLLHLVASQNKSTFVPSLAERDIQTHMNGLRTETLVSKENGQVPNRAIRLLYRKTFPRKEAIQAVAGSITSHLPEDLISAL